MDSSAGLLGGSRACSCGPIPRQPPRGLASPLSARPLATFPPRPQVTFVPPGFTRKPPKYERFIRPTGLRMTKAHVTHPELKATFQLEIIGVKKNPNGQAYTGLGVITKGERGREEAVGGAGRQGGQRCGERREAAAAWWQAVGRWWAVPQKLGWAPRELLCRTCRDAPPFPGPPRCCPSPAAGTIIEVNVSELGLVTPGGKVVWGKYAQGERLPLRSHAGGRAAVSAAAGAGLSQPAGWLTAALLPLPRPCCSDQQPRERWLHQCCAAGVMGERCARQPAGMLPQPPLPPISRLASPAGAGALVAYSR